MQKEIDPQIPGLRKDARHDPVGALRAVKEALRHPTIGLHKDADPTDPQRAADPGELALSLMKRALRKPVPFFRLAQTQGSDAVPDDDSVPDDAETELRRRAAEASRAVEANVRLLRATLDALGDVLAARGRR